MDYQRRIEAFALLADRIRDLPENERQDLAQAACNENAWFTIDNIFHAFDSLEVMLERGKLKKWTAPYNLNVEKPKTVGIVMAGNIPIVGFHDLLTVLISGNHAAVKMSSQDSFLMKKLIQWILEIEPGFKNDISIRERLTDIDAVIATGSDNTSRYFEYYFKDIPHVIRKNRTSVAILSGRETESDLQNLGKDIFWYFGLGCRNVSKVFVPEGYDPHPLFRAVDEFKNLSNNHKYNNNYEYYKSIFLINKVKHLDTGFLLWHETSDLVSPISVLYSETYSSRDGLAQTLKKQEEKIQCVVGTGYIPFGTAQTPEPWDYADNIDTLRFLEMI